MVISGQALGRGDKAPSQFAGRRNVNTLNLNYVPWYINVEGKSDSTNLAKLNIVQVKSSPFVKHNILTLDEKKRNEIDAAKPIAYVGGTSDQYGAKTVHENGYDVREGSNGKGHKHKQKYKNSYDIVGGYEIQAAQHSAGEKWGNKDNQEYIELGETSLPYQDREKLGNGDVLIKEGQDQEYKKTRKIGDKDINVNINVPTPPALNFLPLLRI